MTSSPSPSKEKSISRVPRSSSSRISFEQTATVTVLLISGTLDDAPLLRVTIRPTAANGLHKPSQIMIDKAMSVRRETIGATFGRLDDKMLVAIDRGMALFFGLG